MASEKQEFERTWQPRLWVSLGVLILIVAYLIAFVAGNSDRTSINFVFAEATTSRDLGDPALGARGLDRRRAALAAPSAPSGARQRGSISEASVETPDSISDGDA